MMGRSLQLAVVLLPALGLAGLWATSEYQSRQGLDWEVEVQGYDPRDLLRGHYVEYSYDWAGLEDGPTPEILCLEGDPPGPPIVSRADQVEQCEHPIRANLNSVYGSESLMRGRLYVGQERALEIEELMFDREQRGIIRLRVREDGSFNPIDVRFRPLTESEREAIEELPPPIAIEPAP